MGEVNYFVCDLNKTELLANSYDLVVCWDGLHHILESQRLVKQVYSSLKVNGRFLVFDHIGQESRFVNLINYLFVSVAIIAEPKEFLRTIRRILKSTLYHLHIIQEVDSKLYSPFEDVTGRELISYITDRFGHNHVASQTTLAFGARWLARVRGPQKLRLGLISFVKKIDGFLIRKHIVNGEYIYIEAVKTYKC